MATILTTGLLTLPTQVLDPWIGKVQGGSTVAALTPSIPMKFGAGEAVSFDIGEAEYVPEGGAKGPTDIKQTKYRVGSFKFHKTFRLNEEVQWADEDYQLGVISDLLDQVQPAFARALDFGVYHGINPTGGAKVAEMPNLDSLLAGKADVEIAAGSKPYANLDAAVSLVSGKAYNPTGIALDPSLAGGFTTLRATQTEMRLYPDLRMSTERSGLDGLNASVSRTVGAVGVAATPTNVKAYVGDFGAIRWGIQRQIGLKTITAGDPDGQGDLSRNNQIALRMEIVYGWGIADDGASFARIIDAAA